ncbi:hypothetical protein KEM54_000504 [Ascosphaera aggregata]|nr:hypothetical protein KEM54_000504 [Ascosphaera aggregata]
MHLEYHGVVNQFYPKDDSWLSSDTVFAAKNDRVVDYKPLLRAIKSSGRARAQIRYQACVQTVPTLAIK